MEKRYYNSDEIMDLFGIKKGNYTTFGRVCRDLKLPRIKIGKALLFPVKPFNQRLEIIEKTKMKNFNI
jgi:hypothetical protein